MKLIEADKVEQAIKDYWEAQVDKALTLTDGNEKRINIYLEHNHELLKAVDELPSAEPEAISRWKNEFKEYVDSLDIARDDWKGIIEYIDELPSAEPDTTTDGSNVVKKGGNDGDGTSGDCISRTQAIDKFIDELEEIFSDIREREIDDSVCGLCEYDGAYIGQSGDWCNECPGFDRDDCFKLSDKIRKEWTDEIIKALPSVQPERKTGHWILDRSGAYCCSKCMEPCATYAMMKPRDKFCKMCGSRNEVTE